MSYLILREFDSNPNFGSKKVSGSYHGEENQESSLRLNVLTGLQARLMNVVDVADKFKAGYKPGSNTTMAVQWNPTGRTSEPMRIAPGSQGGGSVKELARWHEQAGRNVLEGDRLAEEAIRIRRWIIRQGAKLTTKGELIWRVSRRTVQYDRELEKQNMTRVEFRGGMMYGADGKPLDTSGMVTVFSGPGYGIYVLSREGHLHVGSHAIGFRHHSTLLAGAEVSSAGELKVLNGRLTYLSNKSGHYIPDVFNLLKTLQVLDQNGVPLAFEVEMLTAGPSSRFASVDAFMRANMFDDDSYRRAQEALAQRSVVAEDGSYLIYSPRPQSGSGPIPSGYYTPNANLGYQNRPPVNVPSGYSVPNTSGPVAPRPSGYDAGYQNQATVEIVYV